MLQLLKTGAGFFFQIEEQLLRDKNVQKFLGGKIIDFIDYQPKTADEITVVRFCRTRKIKHKW